MNSIEILKGKNGEKEVRKNPRIIRFFVLRVSLLRIVKSKIPPKKSDQFINVLKIDAFIAPFARGINAFLMPELFL